MIFFVIAALANQRSQPISEADDHFAVDLAHNASDSDAIPLGEQV